MSFVIRRAAQSIAGIGRVSVADVIDAHLETLSMIFLSTLWAVAYGWVEGTVGIGYILGQLNLPWLSFLGMQYSPYHVVLGLTVFAISFSFGFLKFHRMLYARKRYMLFTALGTYPYALVVQDFSYFCFIPGPIRLSAAQWTCNGLRLGCWQLYNPWTTELYFFPRWYLVALTVAALCFFLAYRSALVNLLVTREVMKQAGFIEKKVWVRVPPTEPTTPTTGPEREEAPPTPPPAPLPIPPPKPNEVQAAKIVDQDRDELIRRLRERLERQGT